MSQWHEFVAGMTPDRAVRIRDLMILMRTREGIEEAADCLVAAMQMLSSEDGHALAGRLAKRRSARPATDAPAP